MSYNSIDDMVRDFAQGAVDIARQFEITLDYSEDSLQHVESILGQLHNDLRHGPPAGRPAAPPTDQMEMMCKLWGGYFGEVVRRRWGGEWTIETYPGGNFATLTLTLPAGKIFPSIKVYRRLTEGEGDNLWKFYQSMRPKLAAAPGSAVQ
ncbi:MAG: hypothetical protein ACRD24_00765 [Terriglobales bacterium]